MDMITDRTLLKKDMKKMLTMVSDYDNKIPPSYVWVKIRLFPVKIHSHKKD